jgi:hypothetical protein
MFQKAVKEKLKARLAIEGPSGSGKTYSALLIARGLVGPGGKIAMIDTEKGSGKLYSDVTNFDHCGISEPYTPEKYVKCIEAAHEYDCLIIDSMTHEWVGSGGILEIHDTMPGNPWTNWAKVNPRHEAFLNAILNVPCHVIVTMRSKQSYAQEQGANGKQQIKKMGMAPQQRDGIEYEFTAVLKMDITHVGEGDKDSTRLFPVGEYYTPTVGTGEKLAAWLDSGDEPSNNYASFTYDNWQDLADKEITADTDLNEWKSKYRAWVSMLTPANASKLSAYVQDLKATLQEAA